MEVTVVVVVSKIELTPEPSYIRKTAQGRYQIHVWAYSDHVRGKNIIRRYILEK